MPNLPCNDAPVTGPDSLLENVLVAIRADSMLPAMAALADAELLEWCTNLRNGQRLWLEGSEVAVVDAILYELGRTGEARGVPPAELIRASGIVLDAVGENDPRRAEAGMRPHPRTGSHSFREIARYYLIRGYEDALR